MVIIQIVSEREISTGVSYISIQSDVKVIEKVCCILTDVCLNCIYSWKSRIDLLTISVIKTDKSYHDHNN